MKRYYFEVPSNEDQDEERTAGSRRAGIVLTVAGVLIMALSMLGGWTPWSM